MLADRAGRCLFGVFCLLYLITARGWVEVGDTWYSIRTSRAMLQRGRLDLLPDNHPDVDPASLFLQITALREAELIRS